MPMKLGEIYRKLVEDDFRLLSLIVRSLRLFDFIPLEYIVKKLEHKYSQKEIVARIKKLVSLKLLKRHPLMDSYRITFLGLDCMALRILVSKDVVKAIGNVIGIGKESIVYQGLSADDKLIAVKFYRIGRQSFRNVLRARGYYEDIDSSSWLSRSIIAGRREKEALTILNRHYINGIPKLYGGALHCIAIEYIDGVRLSEGPQLSNPLQMLKEIIDVVRDVYRIAGLVHGDLSEYNIMISYTDATPYIIDWPQFISSNMPMAHNMLKRDIENLVKFFKRRYRIYVDPQEMFKYVVEQ